MPKGKSWSKAEVEKLRSLVKDKQSWEVMAAELHRSEGAIRQKCRRLGLEVVVNRPGKTFTTTTSELVIPKELPTIQEALKILAAAMKALAEPGLDDVEVRRLQALVTAVRTYETSFANYVRYLEIEKMLVEMKAEFVRNGKKKS
jgi:hypothetical protein